MKSRIITALIIVGVLIPIIYVSPLAFKLFAIVAVCLATHELLEVKKDKKYSILSQGIVYLLNVLPLILINDFTTIHIIYIAALMLAFYCLMIIDKHIDFKEMSYLFTFSIFIIIAANSAMYIRSLTDGFFLVVFVILVTASNDTGAFFAGTIFGKHKLIERISPKKTIEGLVGGIALSVVIGVLYYLVLPTGLLSLTQAIVVSFILGITATLGDLFFSAIKRTYKIKDFSNILPGHGGILDRVDSHLTNLMVFAFIVITLKG